MAGWSGLRGTEENNQPSPPIDETIDSNRKRDIDISGKCKKTRHKTSCGSTVSYVLEL